MNTITAIIQARTGSSRLPGKVMYPLDGRPALEHVITRTASADDVTNVVVATSTRPQDDVIAQCTSTFGAGLIRGSESNVLNRFERAVEEYNPKIILRITGDCPLIDPTIIDRVIAAVDEGEVDYASNISQRTFPRGLDVEAFTTKSFKSVISAATTQTEREHVTPFYRKSSEEFNTESIISDQVFDKEKYFDRTNLRFTLDVAEDYHLLKRIYNQVEYDEILPIRDAIDFVDAEGLAELNESVHQKKI